MINTSVNNCIDSLVVLLVEGEVFIRSLKEPTEYDKGVEDLVVRLMILHYRLKLRQHLIK